VGIGGVLSISISRQLANAVKEPFTTEQLLGLFNRQHQKDDDVLKLESGDTKGAFVETDVSNIILVHGFMEELRIREVHPLAINLSNGILIDPKYWQR
jgi:hypothetical protein